DLRVARDEISQFDYYAIYAAAACCLIVAIGIGVALLRVFREGVLFKVVEGTTHVTTMVFVILIGASIFSLVFRGLGGEELVHELLRDIPGGTVGAILAVMLLMFVLGFFLDFLEIVFIVVPLVAPILLQLEMPNGDAVSPVWLGIMMAVNLQTSFLTPPFGFALFYLRGVAPPSVKTSDIYLGAIPFVLIQMLALVVLWYLPELATWLPTIVYGP
ncbi:MAG: TRAP transporter large permease subunit, partial [Hyphomicrobiales bacterium]